MQNDYYEILNDLIQDRYYDILTIVNYILYSYNFKLISAKERNDLMQILYSTSGLTADEFIKELKRAKRDGYYGDSALMLFTIVPSDSPYNKALGRSFVFDTRHLWEYVDEGVYFDNINNTESFINRILFSRSAVRIMPVFIDTDEYTPEVLQSRYGKIIVLN